MLFAIISIVIIMGIAFGSYFYLQNLAEEKVKQTLLEQQKHRQQENTAALSSHIGSDLYSIDLLLESLAAKAPLQSGDLSSEQASSLLKQAQLEINQITTVDTLFLIDKQNIAVNVGNDKYGSLIGLDLSDREYVQETRSSLSPYVSDSFTGAVGVPSFVIAVPIINSATGEYIGLIGGGAPTAEFFGHYGNIDDLNSSPLIVAVDRNGDFMAAGLVGIIGQNVFGEEVQRTTKTNPQINAMYRDVIAGNPSSALFETDLYSERLATAYPVYFRGEQVMSVILSTPTSILYSQVDGILAVSSIQIFTLLAAVSAAIAVLFVFLIRWNKALDATVSQRTVELKESNEQLGKANAMLSEYNIQLRNAFEQVIKANKRLEENDKLQKEFINIAAHELRTPVQPMLGIADLLEEGFSKAGKDTIEITKAEVDMIIRNAGRLERLSSDLLEVARIESNTMHLNIERLDLSEQINNAIENTRGDILQRQGNNISIEYVEPLSPIILEADRIRIFEVLSNLVGNALKFTSKGVVIISAEQNEDGHKVIIKIRDTGTGIHPDIISRLFTKFASNSETGTGLGLFICKSIVEAHGGKIWAENNPDGRGATFTFTLPLLAYADDMNRMKE